MSISHTTKQELQNWLNHIDRISNRDIILGLDRVSRVAKNLDLLQPTSFIITVAGTNGKGTTCRVLEKILIASGYRVGTYSSPHLFNYTERVRIQGKELDELTHITSFKEIETYRHHIPLTYFEFSTLSALYLFRQSRLDVTILEVGLGGRLDATNIVDTDIAVITSIGLDHMDYLGTTYESIGYEKVGICRTGKPVIVGEPRRLNSISTVALDKNAKVLQVGEDWSYQRYTDRWDFQDEYGVMEDLPLPRLPLPSVATALATLRSFNVNLDMSVIYDTMPFATLPGRFQVLSRLPYIILDVAHNPHATRYLAAQIKSLVHGKRVYAIVGMLKDKDILGTLSTIASCITAWFCVTLEGERGERAEELAKYLPQEPTNCYLSTRDAWKSVRESLHPKDTLLIFGSFQVVAEFTLLYNDWQG